MSKGLSSVVELYSGGPPGLGGELGWGGGEGPGAGSGSRSDDKDNSTPHTQEGRQVDVADFIGSGDEDEDQSLEQDKALADFLSGKDRDELNWVERKIIEDVKKGKELTSYQYDPQRDRYTGYTKYTQPMGWLGGLASILGLGPFETYTGFGKSPFDKTPDRMGGDGEGRSSRITQQVAAPVVEPEVSVTPDSYYATGAGTGTTSLSDLAKINPYLATLYAQTPSPIGQTYEQAMAQVKKQQKERKRLSGLDIFKPVSTVL